MTKYALFSDIHGNYFALKAVLEKINQIGVDQIFCLGDILLNHGGTDEVIELLDQHQVFMLRGNHDERFELADPPAGVHPGSFATVDITTTGAFRGMELPEDAAVRMGSRDAVFVEDEAGLFRPVDVTVVPIRPGLVAVQGIPEGARVVVEGAYFLKSTMEAGEGEGQ